MDEDLDEQSAAALVARAIAVASEAIAEAQAAIIDAPPPSRPSMEPRALAVIGLGEHAVAEASARARRALEDWRAGRLSHAELRERAGEPLRVRDAIAGSLWALSMTAKR